MQKWEYLTIRVTSGQLYTVNGERLKDIQKGRPYVEYLNQLGDQGWEVTGTGSVGLLGLGDIILKRPKV
jgi:hypothetical protein